MNVPKLLTNLKLIDATNCERGRLLCKSDCIDDANIVVEQLTEFGGTGWLCATDQNAIRRFKPESPLEIDGETWPVCAEAVNGNISLHIQRASDCWQLTTVSKQITDGADPEKHIVIKSRFLSRDTDNYLVYEVEWSPTEIVRLTELRPSAYRFVGFEANEEKNNETE